MRSADVAIYLPYSSGLYSRGFGRAGGAERQMTLLAVSLAARGMRVAHVVYPVSDPVPDLPATLRLVHRAAYGGDRRLGGVREAFSIVRAIREADGDVVVVRTGTPVVGVVALYCRASRRKFVFSAANDSDFLAAKHARKPLSRRLYALGLRLADLVVVQSRDQLELARSTYPFLHRVVWVPSLAEDAAPAPAEPVDRAFVWVGRLRDHKQPLLFARLAAELPDVAFRLVGTFADGHGTADAQRLSGELRESARQLPNLELVEPMPHGAIGELIGRSLAVVSTSRLEGMPNIFLEAWARGVPVLTYEVDPDGVVRDRGLGVSAAGDWEAFVAGARMIADGGLDRAALAERSRAYIRDVHSLDAVAGSWQSILDDLHR